MEDPAYVKSISFYLLEREVKIFFIRYDLQMVSMIGLK